MARINYTQDDAQRLRTAIKNFNKTINRLAKQHTGNVDFPSTIKVKAAEKMIKKGNRDYFNKYINRLERINNPNLQKIVTTKSGVKLTAWERNIINAEYQAINKARQSRKNAIAQADYGKMGSLLDWENQMKKNILSSVSPERFRAYADQLSNLDYLETSEFRLNQYRENFLKAMRTNGFGRTKLYQQFREMDYNELFKLTYNNPNVEIQYWYTLAEKTTILNRANHYMRSVGL